MDKCGTVFLLVATGHSSPIFALRWIWPAHLCDCDCPSTNMTRAIGTKQHGVSHVLAEKISRSPSRRAHLASWVASHSSGSISTDFCRILSRVSTRPRSFSSSSSASCLWRACHRTSEKGEIDQTGLSASTTGCLLRNPASVGTDFFARGSEAVPAMLPSTVCLTLPRFYLESHRHEALGLKLETQEIRHGKYHLLSPNPKLDTGQHRTRDAVQ